MLFVGFLSLPGFSQSSNEPETTSKSEPKADSTFSPTAEGLKIYEFVAKTIKPPESSIWERYVRGFRRDHNFSVSSGISRGHWVVDKFEEIESKRFYSEGVYSKFRYSFHIEIYHSFGYLLGSSAGYFQELKNSKTKTQEFVPTSAYQFPGLVGGIVWDMSPMWRVTAAADIFLERHNNIKKRASEGHDEEVISVTAESLDLLATVDYFYTLTWGVRLEAHNRQSQLKSPTSNDKGYFPSIKITRKDQWYGVGLLYHIL